MLRPIALSLVIAQFAAPALAQTASPTAAAAPTKVVATGPRATLARMQRPITVDLKEKRLEDIIAFIQQVAQADIEPLWADDRTGIGLDKDRLISLKSVNRPALSVLEAVLEKASDSPHANSWQLTPEGTLQFGPKELLNRSRRLQIYDINDLLLVIPNFPDTPQIDLNSVLQQGQGGSGQSPFTNVNQNTNLTPEEVARRREEAARKIQDLITTNVEPDQWVDNGGDGGTIRYWNSTLIINAPDYMHRQINGYPFWPSSTERVVNGRRYVSMSMDTGVAKVDGFANSQVTGTAGGTPVPTPTPAPRP